ncbi:MAG: SDR family NAD(P)-dependent oxidoreductase [Patescibacteria group bacterium]
MRLKNKVAIITGAASGIGKDMAENFLKEGARVVYSDIQGKAEEVIPQEHKENAVFIKCDTSKSKQVEKLLDKTIDRFGRVDVMVNNAGIGSLASVMDETDDNWKKVIDINLSGVFYGMRAAANRMKEKKIKGSIINTSSILGSSGLANTIAYSASKGGIEQLTKAGCQDLAPHKIRVNAIAPGFIKTNMTEDVLKDNSFNKMVKSRTPLGHVGEPNDIAKAAVYLASDESGYVTGEILHVDGGWTSR